MGAKRAVRTLCALPMALMLCGFTSGERDVMPGMTVAEARKLAGALAQVSNDELEWTMPIDGVEWSVRAEIEQGKVAQVIFTINADLTDEGRCLEAEKLVSDLVMRRRGRPGAQEIQHIDATKDQGAWVQHRHYYPNHFVARSFAYLVRAPRTYCRLGFAYETKQASSGK